MYPSVIWRARGKNAEKYIQRHWRSVPLITDNNYTLSVYCCVDIIISLNGYCTCKDADDMLQLTICIFCCLLSIDKMKENKQHYKIVWTNKILKMMLNFYGTIITKYYKWATTGQNQHNDMCAQRRLRSACASAQSDQSFRCVLNG